MAEKHASSVEESEETPVETLIQGRARRSTAGRNMSALINAEADDELALLFEEIEDDNDFSIEAGEEEAAELEDDMGLEWSSEDEEDQGPNAHGDDLEGEKELERQAKVERKKRKAQESLRLTALRKKVKIDPTAVSTTTATTATTTTTTTPAPRPRKKSERISWLPTPEEGPTRASSRRQTMQNKELTHARLKDSEEKRIRLIASMEEAAKKKALLKPKEMTQAERLAEAERVERLNSKSLNRWEEMEKRKAEERRAKIEALKNRRLEGPVMSWWSGIATWTNGTLTRIGKVDVTPKPEKEEASRRRSKKADKEDKNGTEQKPAVVGDSDAAVSQQPTAPVSGDPVAPAASEAEASKQDALENQNIDPALLQESRKLTEQSSLNASIPEGSTTEPAGVPPTQSTSTPTAAAPGSEPVPNSVSPASEAEKPKAVDSGSTEQATKTEEDIPAVAAGATPEVLPKAKMEESNPALSPEGKQETASKESAREASMQSESTSTQPAPDPVTVPQTLTPVPISPSPASVPAPNEQGETAPVIQPQQTTPQIHVDQDAVVKNASTAEIPAPPPKIEHTGRNLIVLENFDDKTAHSREYNVYFNSKKPPKLSSMFFFFFLPFVFSRTVQILTDAQQKSHHRSASSHLSPRGTVTR